MTTMMPFLAAQRARAQQMRQASTIDLTRAGAAADLSRALPRQIDDELRARVASGAVLQRFRVALEISAQRGLSGDEQTSAALFAVMHEVGVRAGELLAELAGTWTRDAHRAEGAAGELDRTLAELVALLAPAAAPASAEPPSSADVPQDGGDGGGQAPEGQPIQATYPGGGVAAPAPPLVPVRLVVDGDELGRAAARVQAQDGRGEL